MVDSINTNWMTEFSQKTVRPIVLFDVTLMKASDSSFETFYWCTGPISIFGYDPIVSMPEFSGTELDPVTREISLETLTIKVKRATGDGTLRDLLDTHYVKGKKVDVKLGSANLVQGDFIRLGKYAIDKMKPSPAEFELTLSIAALAQLRDYTMPKQTWVSRHPLECVRRILAGASGSDIPLDVWDDALAADSGSLDPATTANAAIGHFNATRSLSNRQSAPEVLPSLDDTPMDLIAEIMEMLQSTWFLKASTGEMTFALSDTSKAVSRTWTVDDRDLVAPEDSWEGAITEVDIRFALNADNDMFRLRVSSQDAKTHLGYNSGAKSVLRHEVECPWMNGTAVLNTTVQAGDGAGTLIQIEEAQAQGCAGAGTKNDHSNPFHATVPSWAQLSTTRLAYFLFASQPHLNQTNRCEIISFDQATSVGSTQMFKEELAASGNLRRRHCHRYWSYRIKGRNVYNVQDANGNVISSAQTWLKNPPGGNFFVVDITPAIRWANTLLTRAAYGMPRCSTRTWFDQMDVELGDYVMLASSGFDSVNVPVRPGGTDQVWEINGKKLVFGGDQAGIAWKLSFVRESSPWVPTLHVYVDEPIGTVLRSGNVIDGSGNRLKDSGGGRLSSKNRLGGG